jgi:hypothetical protein
VLKAQAVGGGGSGAAQLFEKKHILSDKRRFSGAVVLDIVGFALFALFVKRK